MTSTTDSTTDTTMETTTDTATQTAGSGGELRPVTIGVFGGSFDPPHLGHTLLVSLLQARGELDRLVVAPVFDHPLRKRTRTPFSRRLAMVRAAMRMHREFAEVTDLERTLAREDPTRPSYSLRLLEAVARANPGARVRLVIGSDIVAKGETTRWHRWDRIAAEFEPLVVPRTGYADASECVLPEVSSSEVRAAVDNSDWDAVARRVPAAVERVLRTPQRGTVWVIGQGHVARHAEPWLVEAGFEVCSISSRDVVAGTVAWPETAAPDAVWILASDPAITPVAQALARAGVVPTDVPVFHGAGARSGADLLGPLHQAGHPVGSLHPICALRREHTWPSLLSEACFGLEGDPAAHAFLTAVVGSQSILDLRRLSPEQRLAYHAACALAANHLSVLEGLSADVLRSHGLDPVTATAAMRTLMRSALGNLHALGIPRGVTGPMSRGDTAAVQAHLGALDPQTAQVYEALSARLAGLLSGP